MIQFAKYQATGNDFVMIDNRMGTFDKNDLVSISKLCDRRFGVGADGLVLIEENELHDLSKQIKPIIESIQSGLTNNERPSDTVVLRTLPD